MQKDILAKYIGKQIKKYRKQKDMTQKELGDKIGVKHNTISSYESGTNCPENNTLFAIANALGVNIDTLFPDNEAKKEVTLLPIYKREKGHKAIDGYEPIPADWAVDGEYFFIKAPDYSMANSQIQEGDLLLIRAQEDVRDGEIAAMILDGNLLVRRVFHSEGRYILHSESARFQPIIAPQNVKIIGAVKRNIIKY